MVWTPRHPSWPTCRTRRGVRRESLKPIQKSPERFQSPGARVAYKREIDDLRESPTLTIIELLKEKGAEVSYNDPYFRVVGKGRKYDLQMQCASLDNVREYDCVLIVTDHSQYDYSAIVHNAQLVGDTRNATRGIQSSKIVHC